MLASRFQTLLPEEVVLLMPHVLQGKNNISAPAKLLSTPQHKAVRPRLRFLPYRSQSKRWVLFCVDDDLAAPERRFKLTTLVPESVAQAAFDWARNHLMRTLPAEPGDIVTFESSGSSDADLFAHLASFLHNRAVCEDAAVLQCWRAASLHFGTELLQALQAHEDANFSYLALRCPRLRHAADTLFDALKDAFGLQVCEAKR